MMARVSHHSVMAAGAGIGVTIVVVLTLIHRGSGGSPTCRAALIPAYVPPRELSALAQSPQRPRMVVVNPASGPGAAPNRAYGDAVRELQAAGVRVLGYVHTAHGSRPVATVVNDVNRYLSWYHLDGIFFDEAASDAGQLPYYRTLADAARGTSRRVVVVNPGVPPAPGYFDLADVVVTFEGTYAGYVDALKTTPAWLRQERPDRVAHLLYGASRAEAMRALAGAAAGYVYATSGAMPNPWRTLPPYLHDEVEAVAKCA
jgi:hypothetical protein